MQTPSQRTRTLLIVAIFALAGYLSAQAYASYSSWLDVQDKALHDKYARYERTYSNGGNASQVRNSFYQEQAAMDGYSRLKWAIFSLGFPVALTLAFLLAKSVGWLEHLDLWRGIAGLGLVYLIPGPALFLSGVTWFLLTIPCLAGAAFALAWSLRIVTSRSTIKFCLAFLLSCAFCCLWGWSIFRYNVDRGWNVFFISLEVLWAGIFGLGLAVRAAIAAEAR